MSKDVTKNGAQWLGVKCEPRIKFIPVRNYIFPLTHAGIGLDNDALEGFEEAVNSGIIEMSPKEKKP